MNRKQFLLLLIVVLIVGGAGLLVYQRGNRSWESSATAIGGKLLPNLAINDIAAITIQNGNNTLHLARRDNLWRVTERGNYPANFSQISDWLIKLSDLKIAQSQDVGPSQLGRFALLPPGPATNTATLVEFDDANGKPLATLLLGKKHMKKPTSPEPESMGMGDDGWPDGRYVMVGTSATSLAVISDPLDNAEPKPEQWLNKDFLTVEKPGSISVDFPEATNSWQLTRASETNDWLLTAAGSKEKLDATKTAGVTTPLSSATFNDVLPPDTAAAAAGLTNLTTLTVATLDGFTYTAHIGQKQTENYPVTFTISANLTAPLTGTNAVAQASQVRQKTLTDKLAREQAYQKWIYLLPTYAIDPLLKHRADLLVIETNTPSATNATASAMVK
jgi:hypothetical protein